MEQCSNSVVILNPPCLAEYKRYTGGLGQELHWSHVHGGISISNRAVFRNSPCILAVLAPQPVVAIDLPCIPLSACEAVPVPEPEQPEEPEPPQQPVQPVQPVPESSEPDSSELASWQLTVRVVSATTQRTIGGAKKLLEDGPWHLCMASSGG